MLTDEKLIYQISHIIILIIMLLAISKIMIPILFIKLRDSEIQIITQERESSNQRTEKKINKNK